MRGKKSIISLFVAVLFILSLSFSGCSKSSNPISSQKVLADEQVLNINGSLSIVGVGIFSECPPINFLTLYDNICNYWLQ